MENSKHNNNAKPSNKLPRRSLDDKLFDLEMNNASRKQAYYELFGDYDGWEDYDFDDGL